MESFPAFCRLFIELSFKPKLDIRSKFLYPEEAVAPPRFWGVPIRSKHHGREANKLPENHGLYGETL